MSAPVQPGEVLAGKYKVERVLGVGGMGVVVAATHLHLDQRVALKFLLPEVVKIPEIVARFQREARAAVKIQSEHVARVIDVGTLESGAPYMVMEYLEGSDLSEVVKQRGPVPVESAIEYVLQACEALAEAHVAGIVHRDLKPANLFLIKRADGSPSVKVLDFGISKATVQAPGQGPLTQTSAVMGSPKYMSPEQLKSSRDVDARSDIWALGIVLHELLTGECAFVSKTLPELLVEILQSAPQTLRSRRPELPPGLEAIILRCLEKDPSKRYGSVAELSLALGEFAPPRARVSIDRVTKIVTAAGGPAAVAATNAALSMSASSGQPSAAQPPPGQPAKTVSATQPGAGSYAGQPPGAWRPDATAPSQAQPGYGGPPQPGPGGTAPSGYPPFQGMHGPQPGFGSPQRGGAYGPPLPSPQLHAAPIQAAPRQGMHPALIVMLTLAAVFAFGFGGCMLCVCASAAGGSRSEPGPDVGEAASRPDVGEVASRPDLTALHPDVLVAATLIEGDLTSRQRGSPGGTPPFQRPPGWTTVLPGARSRGMASSGRDAALPASDRGAAPPAFGRDAASPASGRDAASPASGRDAASPASGRDAASPTSGRDAASPTSVQDAASLHRRRRGRRRRKITSGL